MLARLLIPVVAAGLPALLATGPGQAQAQTGVRSEQTFGAGWFTTISPHPDGGFVVAGRQFTAVTAQDPTPTQHPFVVRLGQDGSVRWERAFANRNSGEAQALALVPGGPVRVTGYAGRFVGGPIRRQEWLAELDGDGGILRDDALDVHPGQHVGKFIPITATTFAFYGSTAVENGVPGVTVFVTDSRGSSLWQARMPDAPSECEGAATVAADGGLVAVLGTSENASPNGPRFRRFDGTGRLVRDEPFGGFKDACPSAVKGLASGGFIVAGARAESVGPTGWVALLDRTGALIWERVFGQTDQFVTMAHDVAPAPDGSFVVAGCTESEPPEGVVLRYTRTGEMTGERRFPSADGIAPTAVAVAPDGTIAVAGVLEQRCGLVPGISPAGVAWAVTLSPESLR